MLATFLKSVQSLWSRQLTYVSYFRRDLHCPQFLHLFGVTRVVPDDGDSYDIWRHFVMHAETFEVHAGLEQVATNFSINGTFATRAIEAMATRLGEPLAAPTIKRQAAEKFVVQERQFGESSSMQPLVADGLVVTQRNLGQHERSCVELRRNHETLCTHILQGDCTYYRRVLVVPEQQRLFFTYRRVRWLGSCGTAICVLDLTTGAMVHDAYIVSR